MDKFKRFLEWAKTYEKEHFMFNKVINTFVPDDTYDVVWYPEIGHKVRITISYSRTSRTPYISLNDPTSDFSIDNINEKAARHRRWFYRAEKFRSELMELGLM